MLNGALSYTIAMIVGFIGQGYVGKNLANNFESRGYTVVRYALEEEYNGNKDKIKNCDIVFVAVPTPTTSRGFDDSIVRNVLSLIASGTTVIIKSTVVPGTSAEIQKEYPELVVLFSPEFLSEVTAQEDTASPFSSIIGVTVDDETHRQAAEKVLGILPQSPFSFVCSSIEAELIKYAHNVHGFVQVVLWNLFYDLAVREGVAWENIHKALKHDPFVAPYYHSNPIHKGGRGAGGSCFIKDFAAFRAYYERMLSDEHGKVLLKALERKNIDLLTESGKDVSLLKKVYGESK